MEKNDLFVIFKEKLVTQSTLENLWDLLNNDNIVFSQYYQRHYVWSFDKATSLIESILIGSDIPPIVIFEENMHYSEIIDGRQRFETIKRFVNNEFKLTKGGLSVLKIYKDKYFRDLPENVQNIFKNTSLRIFRYKISADLLTDKELLDSIKKEIFRRYNIGLTPLKQYEIEKAIFIRNDLNRFVKKSLKTDMKLLMTFNNLFIKEESDTNKLLSVKSIELLMKKFRFLVALQEIPISYYSWSSHKNDLINSVFKYISAEANINEVFANFKNNILLVDSYRVKFEQKNIQTTYLIYEILYWIIEVIKAENLDIKILNDNIDKIIDIVEEKPEIFQLDKSFYYKHIITRYKSVLKIVEELYNTNFDKYITTSERSKAKIKEARDVKSKKQTEKFLSKINNLKPDSHSVTISTYTNNIQNRMYNIKPAYQREESMNKQKASGLIESILLDFKIAPIYIYKRSNGVQEVVDGQQRLLTILAFIGKSFLDSKGRVAVSSKMRFKLTGLKYLSAYNGLTFEQLPEEMQKRILNFTLSIIILNEDVMPQFDPVDLFIRLNNKPYPIKEHSFEMWNASMSNNIIKEIKILTAENSDWLYVRTKDNNKRMQNEEMMTTLMYMEHQQKNLDLCLKHNYTDIFQIFAKNTNISCRIKDKKLVSQLLEDLSLKRNEFDTDTCIAALKSYINKLKILLECENSTLKDRMNGLICPYALVRSFQTIFLLRYILSPIDEESIEKNRDAIYTEIQDIIKLYKKEYPEEEKEFFFAEFMEKINSLQKNFAAV